MKKIKNGKINRFWRVKAPTPKRLTTNCPGLIVAYRRNGPLVEAFRVRLVATHHLVQCSESFTLLS